MSQGKKKQNSLGRLLKVGGSRAALSYVGCVLSAVNAVLAIMPLVCIWFVMRDLVAVYPHFEQAMQAGFWAMLAVVFAVAGVVVYFAALMCTHLSAFRVAANMRKAMLRHLSRVPLGYFSTHSTGELRRTIDQCSADTENMMAHKLPDFVGSLVTPIAFLAVVFIFDWIMGLVCLIPLAVSFFALWWMMGRNNSEGGRRFMELYQEALLHMSAAATEYVRGIPVVKVFQQSVHSMKAFSEAISAFRDRAYQYALSCRTPQVIQLVAINATFAVLVPAGIAIAATTGDFAGFLTDFLFYVLFSAITTSMMSKVMYASEAVMIADEAVRRMDTVLSVPVVDEVDPAEALHPRGADVELKNAVFAYPGTDRAVVDDVCLSIPEGSTVALVGPSGGGKSTIASLIPRFWDVDAGCVLVGGCDVRKMTQSELMDHVAFVFQDDHLFKQSLADNIRAGRPEASDGEVLQAARAAQCDDIIAKFPHGLDTVVGAHGVYLSGGECQRIALARAILKNAPIVVLDEATAFADPENEALIQRALGKLCQGKTVLLIAHRLSTITGVDRIFVVDRGRIVESGSHDRLVESGGLYAQMWADYQVSATWKIERGDNDAA